MLVKVTLVNFQAHKYLEVDCAGFTTLTGGSNGGKSAVLRAIQGLVRNDSAADYVRHGQKTLSVKLDFDDGYSVEWIKGSGENKYVLSDSDGNRRVFDKVGSDVPEEVKQVLRLGPIAVKNSDKEYVNFHNQLESPFLISSTPGSVAKLFGELTSASDLYSAVSEGNRQVRSTNALKTTRKTDIEKIKDSLIGYDNLDSQVTCLTEGRLLFDESVSLSTRLKNIEHTVNSIKTIDKSMQSIKSAISELTIIENINIDALYEDAQRYVGIGSLVLKSKKFDDYELAAASLVKNLELTSNIDIVYLEEQSSKLITLKTHLDNIYKIDNNIKELESKITETSKYITGIEKDILDATALLDVCSECGQELTHEAKIALIEGASEHAAC